MPEPLHRHLDSPTDEARISRMWEQLQGRRAAGTGSARRMTAAVAAAGLLATAAAWGWFGRTPEPPSAEAAQTSAEAAPGAQASVSEGTVRRDEPVLRSETVLRDEPVRHDERTEEPRGPLRVDGETPDVLESGVRAQQHRFSDGSTVRLSPETRLEALHNDAERVSLLLAHGAARFEVTPGGPRRWTIEGGEASVEVVGTVFEVDRRGGGLRVEVERGVVVVRGERVPDRVVRLTRGERLELPARRASHGSRPPGPPVRGRVELATGSAGIDGLLSEAREAGARGQHRRQAALLQRASEGDDPRAALAAFTLGRLEMDQLDHPQQARTALRRALGLGLPRRLAEQARARLATLGSPSVERAPRELEAPRSLLPNRAPEPATTD